MPAQKRKAKPSRSTPVLASKRSKVSATSSKSKPKSAKQEKTVTKTKSKPRSAKQKKTVAKTNKVKVAAPQPKKVTKKISSKKAVTPKAKAAGSITSKKTASSKKAAPTKKVNVVATAQTKPVTAAVPSTPVKAKKTEQEVANLLNGLVTTAWSRSLQMSDFDELSVNDLKKALRHNDRSSTGKRSELIKALIDCVTNGCPPRCPQCGGGRLRYGMKNGKKQYWCPGFMEDTDFIACSFTVSSIARVPWKQL